MSIDYKSSFVCKLSQSEREVNLNVKKRLSVVDNNNYYFCGHRDHIITMLCLRWHGDGSAPCGGISCIIYGDV